MNDYLAMLLGVACAGAGGELFVRGAVGIGRWARISPGIVGATVAAFATSSPELSVSVSSALAGKPQIALGDALGSNVVNVALILALALSISGIQSPRHSMKRDFPVALAVPVVTGVLILDGVLSRADGLLMLSLFSGWLVAVVFEARKQRNTAEDVIGERKAPLALILCIAGLALLSIAGALIVAGAKGVALSFGVDEFIVGAVIVAVGTSTPELATTIVSRLRGHEEISLGTILGSNIFNGLFIISIAAIISPIAVDWREAGVALAFGFIAVAFTFPAKRGFIGRWRAAILLALYCVYLAAILLQRA